MAFAAPERDVWDPGRRDAPALVGERRRDAPSAGTEGEDAPRVVVEGPELVRLFGLDPSDPEGA